MVVKQANITSYKVSDPSDILDRRPVFNFRGMFFIIRVTHEVVVLNNWLTTVLENIEQQPTGMT